MGTLDYAEIGATEFEELPAGYRHVRRRVRVGHGAALAKALGDAVLTFELQRRVGLRPVATAPRAAVGVEFVGRLGVGPISLRLPCRVVWTTERDRLIGMGFGTLPGHPELGEEAFLVERDEHDDVWFEVRAFSRPRPWYVRMGKPVAVALQEIYTNRYVSAARAVG